MMGPYGMYPASYNLQAMSQIQNRDNNVIEIADNSPPRQQEAIPEKILTLRYHQELTQRRYAELAKVGCYSIQLFLFRFLMPIVYL
jgi:hypothetical protein